MRTGDEKTKSLDATLRQVLGEEIQYVRTSLELTRRQFVTLVPSGISEHTLTAYELGIRRVFVTRLLEICAALNISPALVLDRTVDHAVSAWSPLASVIPQHPHKRQAIAWLRRGGGGDIFQLVNKHLGVQLETARMGLKLSQKHLAFSLHFSNHALSAYERAATGLSTSRYIQLCVALNEAPGNIMERALRAARSGKPVERPPTHSVIGRTWNDVEARQMDRRYREGASANSLAARSGRSPGTIRDMVESRGTPLRKREPSGLVTPREREILELLAEGKSHADIAGELGITPGSAKTMAHRIFRKLGVHNARSAIDAATEQGVPLNVPDESTPPETPEVE